MRLPHVTLFIASVSISLGASTIGRAGNKRKRPPLKLQVEAPAMGSLEYRSSYPLRFRIFPRDATVPFGTTESSSLYPEFGLESFLILEDQDDCPSMIIPTCPDIPGDERFLRFYPDTDAPGTPDFDGDIAIRLALTDPGNAPNFTYNGNDSRFGPGLPYSTVDGIGYGPNDDLPGFVLLSNVGPGLVLEGALGEDGNVAGFVPLLPNRARNLAGLMTDVNVELRSAQRSRTVIRTSVMVPQYMFSTFRIIDPCLGGVPFGFTCEGGEAVERVDGSRIRTPSDLFRDELSTDSTTGTTNVSEVVVRAFIVEGVAPTFIDDCNMDAEITAEDAECMGFTLLSNETIVEFRQMGNHRDCAILLTGPWTGPQGNALFVDFDNNGPPGTLSCPTGGGRVTTPPR